MSRPSVNPDDDAAYVRSSAGREWRSPFIRQPSDPFAYYPPRTEPARPGQPSSSPRSNSSHNDGYLSHREEEIWWREASDSDSEYDSDSDSEYDSEEEERLLQQEWEASVTQFQTIVSVVLLPYLGKFYGRRFG